MNWQTEFSRSTQGKAINNLVVTLIKVLQIRIELLNVLFTTGCGGGFA
jgi:hypothetical protein